MQARRDPRSLDPRETRSRGWRGQQRAALGGRDGLAARGWQPISLTLEHGSVLAQRCLAECVHRRPRIVALEPALRDRQPIARIRRTEGGPRCQ